MDTTSCREMWIMGISFKAPAKLKESHVESRRRCELATILAGVKSLKSAGPWLTGHQQNLADPTSGSPLCSGSHKCLNPREAWAAGASTRLIEGAPNHDRLVARDAATWQARSVAPAFRHAGQRQLLTGLRYKGPRGTGDIENGHHYLVAIHQLEPDDAAAPGRTGHPSPRSS